MLKRLFDITAACLLLALLAVPMLFIAALIRITSPGPAVYWSKRVGRRNILFLMPKFRSMRCGAPAVATHLLTDSRQWITPVGKVLRSTSLDELPQLWSVLKGDMSFVGPRPALFNQDDLIAARTRCGVHFLTPGITGWAQINGRDELPIPIKVQFDHQYLQTKSFVMDIKILLNTALKVIRREGVRQADDHAPRAKAA